MMPMVSCAPEMGVLPGGLSQQNRMRDSLAGSPAGSRAPPQLQGGAPRAGGHPAALVELHARLDRQGDDRTRAQPGDERLIVPAAGQVDAVGHRVERAGLRHRARRCVLARIALEDDVGHAQRLAQRPLVGRVAVLVDDEVVRADIGQVVGEVQVARAARDERPVHAPDGLHHVQPLLLGVHRPAPAQLAQRAIRADGHDQVAVLG